MASTIVLTFNSTPVVGDNLLINIDIGGGSTVNLSELFVTLRQNPFQVTTSQLGMSIDRVQNAQNYTEAWNLDHKNTGGSNNLIASMDGDNVMITLKNPSWQFLDPTGNLITESKVSYVLDNEPVEPAKSLKLDGYSTGDCTSLTADYSVTGGNGSYKVYVNNVLTLDGVASPFQLPLNRGVNYQINVKDTTDTQIGFLITKVPRKLIPSDFQLTITNLDSGANVFIDRAFISSVIEPYEYSLDGVTYKTENTFTGITDGNYTLYVKDAFGCVVQKDFVIDGITELTETIFNVSEINALRFARIESGKKNIKNTLSCHELKQVAFPFYHKYLENDSFLTQFKTNAKYLNIYAIDVEGNKSNLTPIQQTENLGLEAKTTSTYFDLGGGRSGIYFGVVDKLDPLTDAVLETVNYGFTLPEFANQAGKYVTIEGIGQVPINSVGYSETYESFILEFNISYTGAPTTKKISATYNLQPYEVYEFLTDMSSLPEQFNIVMEAGASAEELSHEYISEAVKRVKDSDKLLEIVYKDSRNKGDMNYQTGIFHRILLDGYSDYVGEQETEGYNGDAEYYVTDNSVFDSERFVFDRISSAMVHKLRLVFAHESVIINGLSYKIAEAPEINTNITNNLKTFSVLLKRGGDQFLDNNQEIIVGSTENDIIAGAIEASQGNSLLLWTKQNN